VGGGGGFPPPHSFSKSRLPSLLSRLSMSEAVGTSRARPETDLAEEEFCARFTSHVGADTFFAQERQRSGALHRGRSPSPPSKALTPAASVRER